MYILFILKFIHLCVNNMCELVTSNQESSFQNGRQLWKQLVPEFMNVTSGIYFGLINHADIINMCTYHMPSDCYQEITKVFQNGRQ